MHLQNEEQCYERQFTQFLYFNNMQIKILLFLITLAFTGDILCAQEISVGILHSIYKNTLHCKSISNVVIDNVGWDKNFGIILKFSINKNLFLQTEFTKRRNAIIIGSSPEISGGGFTGRYEMTYFTIPVIAGIEFGRSFQISCYTGLYFNFLNNAHNKIIYTSTASPQGYQYDHSYDPENELRKFGTGPVFGLGVKIRLCCRVWISVDSRYETGFTKAVNDIHEYEAFHLIRALEDIYFHSFSANWGIIYGFGKKD